MTLMARMASAGVRSVIESVKALGSRSERSLSSSITCLSSLSEMPFTCSVHELPASFSVPLDSCACNFEQNSAINWIELYLVRGSSDCLGSYISRVNLARASPLVKLTPARRHRLRNFRHVVSPCPRPP